MKNRRIAAVISKMAILGLAVGYFYLVLVPLIIGLTMAGDDQTARDPVRVISMIVVFGLLPPIALFGCWRLADKFEKTLPKPS
jgi:hypothetical protein